ncbi:MAG TPA: ribosome-associated translation inhibitor RaiA [Planctomycetota bacterium]|nr:ribosome-associated translation inhibitor RaiA [Planctomycetota bacterium]
MKVTVTARHAKFTEALKSAARAKARHLEHFFDHLKKIEVILDLDGDTRYSAEMIASGLHDHLIVSRASDRTALAALDRVLEKMERQLIKFKEKLTRKGDHRTPRKAAARTREGSADVWW